MPDLVTLAEAKEYCRIDGTFDDAALATMIAAASDAVREYATAWDGTGDVPARLKLAALARVAESYDNRERLPAATNERGMLQPHRELEL
jgi:uncharacterized phage protein (predicted DNA packaging)